MVKDKRYSLATPRLGIPVPGPGDCIQSEVEMRKWVIVENMLVAALKTLKNCVFEEGELSLVKGDDGSFTVELRATGARPSISGVVGGAYFKALPVVRWEGIEGRQKAYLYIRGSRDTFAEPSDVRPVVMYRPNRDLDMVLVATLDLSGDDVTVDRQPDGKVSAKDISEHVGNWDNPHGETQVQDSLVVAKKLVMGEGASIEGLFRTFDLKTGGPDGVRVEGGSNCFVMVEPGTSDVGRWWVRRDGSGVWVCNDGKAGESIRVMVLP